MKKMHVYVPKGGYTCTYMVTALLFRDTFIMTDYIEKSNTEIAWIDSYKALYRLNLYNLSFIFSKNTIIYNSMFFIVIANIFNECFNYNKIFRILCIYHICITSDIGPIFATQWTYIDISILTKIQGPYRSE